VVSKINIGGVRFIIKLERLITNEGVHISSGVSGLCFLNLLANVRKFVIFVFTV